VSIREALSPRASVNDNALCFAFPLPPCKWSKHSVRFRSFRTEIPLRTVNIVFCEFNFYSMIKVGLRNPSYSYNNMDTEDIPDEPIDELIPQTPLSNIIQDYISMYPEDAPKWLEFLHPDKNDYLGSRKKYMRTPQKDLDALLNEMNYPVNLDQTKVITPESGCVHCKQSWEETQSYPLTQYMCGHKFHTLCSAVYYNETDTSRCPIEGCGDNTIFRLSWKIHNDRRAQLQYVSDTLMNAIVVRPDFKKDLKDIKQCIRKVSSSNNHYNKEVRRIRKRIIKKHMISIQYLQDDMNKAAADIGSSEKGLSYKRSLLSYRKKAGQMFRKYNISLRDLREKKLVKASWHIRWVLEQHRTLDRKYKFGFRISPGKRSWYTSETENDV